MGKSLQRHSPPKARAYVLLTLGTVSLSRVGTTGASTPILGPGKLLGLLAHLTCRPNRRSRTDELVELLWSDRDSSTAHHDLRQSIWQLRQRLGRGAIACQDGEVSITMRVDTDRDRFLTAVQMGQLAQAVDLYRGAFLPPGARTATNGFEEWVEAERYRLRRVFTHAGESVARGHMAARRFSHAQALARRVRDADSQDEGGWRLLLETQMAGGDHALAQSEADVLEWQLGISGREPDPTTRALLRRVRQHATPAIPAFGITDAAFVGRDAELVAVLSEWQRALRGRGSHVRVISAAGFGKTRFLNVVKNHLLAVRATVIRVAANAQTREVPFVLASEVAAALASLPGSAAVSVETARSLVALHPALSSRYPVQQDESVGGEAIRRRLLALGELCQQVAEERPFALLLDDIHWADPPSRQLLVGLLERIRHLPMLVITAGRPMAEPDGLETPRTHHLRALTVDDVRRWMHRMAALPAVGWATELPHTLHDLTAGSPLVLLDLLERANAQRLLFIRDACWQCPPASHVREALNACS